jgi:hypothetical protein
LVICRTGQVPKLDREDAKWLLKELELAIPDIYVNMFLDTLDKKGDGMILCVRPPGVNNNIVIIIIIIITILRIMVNDHVITIMATILHLCRR